MKTFLNKIAILAVLVFSAGCSDTETYVDEVFETTTRGTVLKTVENETNLEFNVGVENKVTIAAEVIDQRGQDFEKVNVYMSFIDNNEEDGDESRDEMLFDSIKSEDFDRSGEYPKLDFSFTEVDVNNFFNLTENDYTGGDRFDVRLELVMNDGRVFSIDNLNNVVSGGAFYRSPFQYKINVTCFVPEDYFVGDYLMQRTSSQESPFGDSFTTEGQIVNITRDGADRVFEFTYFPGSFDFNQKMTLSLICNEIFVNGSAASGALGCGDGSIGQSNTETPTIYDIENDDEIIIEILDFEPDAGCGTGSYPVTLKFTKQ